jgi:HK97 family phage prohead protease
MKSVNNSHKQASKTLDFTVTKQYRTKDAGADCIIEGYANTKSKDRVGDVVLPAAFDATLPMYMTNPVMLENHDWDKPAGFIIEAKTDDNGLWVRARVSDARSDLKTMCSEGTLRTFSIGYNEVLADYDEPTKTKIIKELELLEISIVTVPANSEAIFALSGSAAAPKPAESQSEGEADPEKSSPKPKSAKDLKNFIADVKSVCERDLSVTEVEACCSYFLSNEDIMKKSELIAELKKATLIAKSADAAPGAVPVPAPAPAAQAPGAGHQDPSAAMMEAIKQLAAKLDAIAQGVAQCLEGLKEDAAEDAAEDSEDDKQSEDGKKPEDGKPADEGKGKPAADAKPADGEKPSDDDQEASDEDMKKALEEIEKIESEMGGADL